MYRCQITGKCSKLGEPLNKVTALTREKVYTKWICDEDTRVWHEVEAGRGSEIVLELSLSAEGVAIWNSWSDEDRRLFLNTR